MNKYLFIIFIIGFASFSSAQATSSKRMAESREKAEVVNKEQQENEPEDLKKANEMMKRNAVFNTKNETPPAEGNSESPVIISTNKKQPN